jgi:hypothetical protein
VNGDTTGLESTDTSSTSDPLRRWRHARDAFRNAAQAAAEVSEWKLEREATDAYDRAKAEIQRQEVQHSRVDGEDSKTAREGQEV